MLKQLDANLQAIKARLEKDILIPDSELLSIIRIIYNKLIFIADYNWMPQNKNCRMILMHQQHVLIAMP